MYLPTGIDGLKERQEERENEKIGLHINNSFLTVQANYTFTEVATRVCMNPILKAETGYDCLFKRESHVCTWGNFFCHCDCLCLHLSLSACTFLYLFDSTEM